jgi:uncharacterized membrane protein YphA (DoxX/SURF4 family)
MALLAIPSQILWSYAVGGLVVALWLAATFLRSGRARARGLDTLLLLGPVFYAAPLAAFGTEHFTLTDVIASLIPAWIPWHRFLTYLIGAAFIAAALALVTRIRARLAASLLALTFFCFVVLMDIPSWLQDPRDRFGLTLALRELSFSGGALALAATLPGWRNERRRDLLATVARYFVAIPVVVYGVQQLMHGDHVPAVPLKKLMPEYVLGHGIWTYLAGVIFLLAGSLLLLGRKRRAAATWLGATVLWLVLIVYVPIAVMQRASFEGLNYFADTLMFCGALLLLAGAMPREVARRAAPA